MDEIKKEQALIELLTIKVDFSPVLYIVKTMETFQGQGFP